MGYAGVREVSDIAEAEKALRAFSADAGSEGAILICGARDPALPRLARQLAQSTSR